MDNRKRNLLEQETQRRYLLLLFQTGLKEIWTDQYRLKILVLYLLTALLLSIIRPWDLAYSGPDIFDAVSRIAFSLSFPFLVFGGLAMLILWAGTPSRAKSIQNNLQRIGLVNHASETPLLIAVRTEESDDIRSHMTVLEFLACGVPKSVWEDKRADIETALNIHIADIRESDGKRRIQLYTVPATDELPKLLPWKDAYLRDAFPACKLVLGESLLGPVTLDLNLIPHVLLGGGTGSGKSVLLKLMLMQCLKQPNIQVTIADFKGGVDFGSPWRKHPNCKLILDRETLLYYLDDVTEKLEQRKDVLGKVERRDIYDYNRHEPIPMDRIVFAVDEVAEILDKTGLTKEEKEQVARIENRLSTIARQGRAFGIHLFLSTQRPDANILSGQIRNNIGYRICGRADNVLSMIILDNTDASDKIPHDAQGRFLTGDGMVFQAYWFDDTKEMF